MACVNVKFVEIRDEEAAAIIRMWICGHFDEISDGDVVDVQLPIVGEPRL